VAAVPQARQHDSFDLPAVRAASIMADQFGLPSPYQQVPLMIARFLAVAFALAFTAGLSLAEEPAKTDAANISFKKFTLDGKFRSEGVCAGDFNHDGKLDIAAGPVYYAAPDWQVVQIDPNGKVYDPKGYSNSFCNWADDVNGDGWDDLIVVDFPGTQTWWWENPGKAGGAWKRHTCIKVTNNESPTYWDIDGDGKRELVCSTKDKEIGSRYIIARPGTDPTKPWQVTKVSEELTGRQDFWTHQFYHGMGVGDVNRDGRQDVVIRDGWWQAPTKSDSSATASTTPWTFHPAPLGAQGGECAQMYVYDYDGDGRNDVLCSSGHKYGIWWYQQTADGWKMNVIDKSFSESHAMCLADVNGDGLPDFLTGKRWWSHARAEPGADDPAVLKWFELSRKDGKPVWTAHQIDDDSGVGTQFEVVDMNGDKLLDVIVANKKGAFYFQQQRSAK
jgi:hypothetical protein